MTDMALWEQWVRRRDAEAFEQIIRRHANMVYATCRRILHNATEAEDVTQQCFERLAETRKGPARNLAAWLHRVATNLALNRVKAEQRRRDREARFAQGQADQRAIEWDDVYDLVDEALLELPDKLHEVVVAHFYERQSHAAVAQSLGLSRQTVTYRIHQGVNELRRTLQRRGVTIAFAMLSAGLTAETSAAAPTILATRLAKIALAGLNVPRSSLLALGPVSPVWSTAHPYVIAATLLVTIIGGISLFSVAHDFMRPVPSARVVDTASHFSEGTSRDESTTPTILAEARMPIAQAASPPAIHGTILLPDGSPAVGARVEVHRRLHEALFKHAFQWGATSRSIHVFTAVFDDPNVVGQTETDARGFFILSNLPPDEELLCVVVTEEAVGGMMVKPLGHREERDADISLSTPVPLTGRVVTEAGEAVAGARIRVWGWYPPQVSPYSRAGGLFGEFYGGLMETTADDDGRFELPGGPEGWVVESVSAESPGFAPGFAWHEEDFPESDTDQIAAILHPPLDALTITLQAGVTIRGTVSDADGVPVAGATIQVQGKLPNRPRVGLFQAYGGNRRDYREYTAKYRRVTTSNADGSYTITGVHPTLFQIDAVSGDLASDFTEFAPQSSDPLTSVNLVLRRVGSIAGTVINADSGMPMKTRLAAWWSGIGDGDRGMETESDAAGRFHFDGCRPGPWQVSPGYGGWNIAATSLGTLKDDADVIISLEPGEYLRNLNITLRPTDKQWGTILGVVYDAANRPVANAEVHGVGQLETTDEEGRFEGRIPYSGETIVAAFDPETGMSGVVNTAVAPGQETDADIYLTLAPASATGSIYKPDGSLYTDPVELRLVLDWGEQRIIATEGGRFETGPVPPGHNSIGIDTEGLVAEPQSGYSGRVESGQHLDGLDFVITPMTGEVSGTVRYPAGNPAKGVWLELNGWNVNKRGKTDQDGHFAFAPVGGDEMTLVVGSPSDALAGGGTDWVAISHLNGESQNLEIVIEPLGTVRGISTVDVEACPQLWLAIGGASGYRTDVYLRQNDFALGLPPDVYTFRFESCTNGRHIEEVVIPDIIVESNKVTDLGTVEVQFKQDAPE